MLFTQELTIPESGTIRIGTIGGSPDVATPDGNRAQIGFQLPPRTGLLTWYGTDGGNDIYGVAVEVEAYGGRLISGMVGPGSVSVELPSSISFTGEPGTTMIVEAWVLYASPPHRGARATAQGDATAIPIPQWADTMDVVGGDTEASPTVTFKDGAGATIGVWVGGSVGASIVGLSVPNGSVTADFNAVNGFITFRQG